MVCDTITAERFGNNISNIHNDTDVFSAVRAYFCFRFHEQMETITYVDAACGLDSTWYAVDASAYHHFLRTGFMAGAQYLERGRSRQADSHGWCMFL